MTVRLDDVAARATAQSLETILGELEAQPESPARTLAFDAVDALLQLHGEGLARIVTAHREGRLSNELLGSDEVVSQLLAVHGLVRSAARQEPLVQLERRKPTEEDAEDEIIDGLGDLATECQLCAAPITANHRHLLDGEARQLVCACDACALTFDGRAEAHAGTTRRYRLIPRRVRSLDATAIDEDQWTRLELPVDIAFMFMSSSAGRPVAFYPGPMGTTESVLPLPAWDEIVSKSPILATLEPDVEAILVHRTHGARDYWLVPVDECYRLAGAMRATWEGISGGDAVRSAIRAFFRRLEARDAASRRHQSGTGAVAAGVSLEQTTTILEGSCPTT